MTAPATLQAGPTLPAVPPAGPAWLAPRREAARARFSDAGLPTTRWEDWRYTDVRPIGRAAFAQPAETVDTAHLAAAIEAYVPSGAPYAFAVDGRLLADASRLDALPAGAAVRSLHDAEDGEADERDLATLAGCGPTPFAALNTASFEDAVLVELGPGVELAGPLYVVHVHAQAERPTATHPRTFIRAGAQSKAQVIELYLGGQAGALTNAVTEVVCEERSVLHVAKLGEPAEGAFHVASWVARQAEGSRLAMVNITLPGRIVRNDIAVTLAGEEAEAHLYGLALGGGAEHTDNHTDIDHAVPSCRSFEAYKAVLGGRTRAVFNGRVLVREDAQKTDAKQENRTLLLTDEARIDTKPQLEIFADDVRCTHGATVGQLDERALFYLETRGIPEPDARRLLTRAFAADIADQVPAGPVRKLLEARVHEAVDRLLAEAEADRG